MKPTVLVDFCDFRPGFRKSENFYIRVLRERFDVQLSDQPDFLFYGSYGHEHRLHSGVRIHIGWEPVHPDYRYCDYAVTSLKSDHPRHLYLPFYTHYVPAASLVRSPDETPDRLLAAKTKFCAIVLGKRSRKSPREEFFSKLSRHKRVDSAGFHLNNIGGPISGGSPEKIAFLRDYKFNIAFENESLPGFTTEKIIEPLIARCLPVYWGAPDIAEAFNPRSFLNYADFPSDEALIEKIMDLDRDDAKYLDYLAQPGFHDNTPHPYWQHQRIHDFFNRVFTERIEPVAQRRRRAWHFFGRWTLVKRHHWHPAVRHIAQQPPAES